MKKSVLTIFAGVVAMGLVLFTSNVTAAKSCLAGKYLDGNSCKNCPNGQISALGATSCTTCPTGTYEQNHTKCTACPAGSYCVNGIKTTCANGYVSAASAGACTYCAAGTYEKNNKSCETCPAGKYCTGGSNQTTCPKGSYCPAGVSSPIACTGNNYTNATGKSACSACTASNKAVNAAHTSCDACTSVEQPNADHTACVPKCVAGQYVSGKTCKTCDAGYYCPNGETRTKCANGYISAAGASACTVCPNGTYEKNNTSCPACPAGKYCTAGKQTNCPAGSYCPEGAAQPTACTGITYTSTAGQSSCNKQCDGKTQIINATHTGCTTCSGKQEPNAEHTQCVAKCDVGQYYNAGKCKDCEAGYYCPDGKNRTACPAGTANPNTKSAAANACAVCTGITYTNITGQSSCNKQCDGKTQIVNADHKGCENCKSGYTPNADHTACVVMCPAGQYHSAGKCKDCEAGYYCPDGLSRKTCASGQVPTADHKACEVKCNPGYFLNASKRCEECPAGYYCADGKKTACPKGSISTLAQSSCTVCPDGTYAKSAISCEACPAGKYCTKGIGTSCSSTQYCLANSSQPTACPANATCDGKTFKCKTGYEKEGEQCITKCAAGQYYNISKCKDCEAGYYCADGKNRTACPAGTANPNTKATDANACVACAGNSYTNVAGKSSCSICSSSNQIVKADHTGCENCKAGYTSNAEHTACELKCAVGQWWSSEISKCVACSGNYYCPDGLLRKTCAAGQVPTADHTACEVKCEAGYFLNASKRCEECPAGYYCADGKKTACPKGQYQDKTRMSTCIACTGNTYTSTTGATKCAACSADKKVVNETHTACVACKANEQSNDAHTACIACKKALYNGICDACRANYPRKQAYACSVNNPICDAQTGNCVSCQADFGSKAGATCPEETPICNKKTGMCEASSTKVACTSNLKWEALQGSATSCPIGKPICQNGTCAKCTTDKDCLFDIGNGVHHEGARCESNGTCTWAESIACPANAEVNRKTLQCECTKNFVMQNGQCVAKCSLASWEENGVAVVRTLGGWNPCQKCNTETGNMDPITSDALVRDDAYRLGRCLNGEFYLACNSVVTDECHYCDDQTAEVVARPNGTQCLDGRGACQNGQCVQQCPFGWTYNDENNACTVLCLPKNGMKGDNVFPDGYSRATFCDTKCDSNSMCIGIMKDSKEEFVMAGCAAGYLADTSLKKCDKCPVGGVCYAGMSPLINNCQEGYLLGEDRRSCVSCPKGGVCDGHTTYLRECQAGYLLTKDKKGCNPCPEHGVCNGKQNYMLRCEDGYLMSKDRQSCLSCPEGATCDGFDYYRCERGYIMQNGQCVASGSSTPTTVKECKDNQYLSNGNCLDCPTPVASCAITTDVINKSTGCVAQKKMTCSTNKVCNKTTGKCETATRGISDTAVTCPAGQYLRDGDCLECMVGHYCKNNESYACPAGTYNDQRGSTSKSACKLCWGAASGAASCTAKRLRK